MADDVPGNVRGRASARRRAYTVHYSFQDRAIALGTDDESGRNQTWSWSGAAEARPQALKVHCVCNTARCIDFPRIVGSLQGERSIWWGQEARTPMIGKAVCANISYAC